MRRTHKHESNEARLRGGLTSSSCEDAVTALEPRGQTGTAKERQQEWKNASEQQKAYAISQEEVRLAWLRVRAKGGVGGVDGECIKSFEKHLNKNLYKLWNRMSSGSYHPQAVLRVEIPKGDGKLRPLGIPTILDRVAQEVVRARFEPVMEKFFHRDSYGFRPGKSAPEAVKTCRERCWKYDWVLDVDIQKFFDTIDHELMMKAVEHHSPEGWQVLYIQRWLKAPIQHRDGRREETHKGTPQGGVISPLLANLYLHYAFDKWMERSFPEVKFERYADDIVIHCESKEQSDEIERALAARLQECKLALHPEKTKVVYCKDGSRKGRYPTKKFTFLGYTFQPRSAQNQATKRIFTRFLPAVSTAAEKKFRNSLKECRILKMRHLNLDELTMQLNQRVRGWYGYFSHFYKSALSRMNDWLDGAIVSWLRHKYAVTWANAHQLLQRLVRQNPKRFAHWLFRLPGRAV
jgi:group II intron reverse transcriptase/maturase